MRQSTRRCEGTKVNRGDVTDQTLQVQLRDSKSEVIFCKLGTCTKISGHPFQRSCCILVRGIEYVRFLKRPLRTPVTHLSPWIKAQNPIPGSEAFWDYAKVSVFWAVAKIRSLGAVCSANKSLFCLKHVFRVAFEGYRMPSEAIFSSKHHQCLSTLRFGVVAAS